MLERHSKPGFRVRDHRIGLGTLRIHPVIKLKSPSDLATATDVEVFSALAHLIYEGALDPSTWRVFLKLLTERLNGNAAVLILRVPRMGEIPLTITHGGDPALSAPYFQHYMALDPFVQLPEGRALTLHDFVDPADLEKSDHYRDYLLPQDIAYVLGVDLRDSGRFHVRLRFCRSPRAGNFSAEDCRTVEMFSPHLKTAIHLYSEIDTVRSQRASYAEAMDQLTLATLVLDENCRVLHANQLAESILAERDGITRSNDQLLIANHEDSKRFREVLGKAVDAQRASKPGLVSVMRVRRSSGKPDIGLVVRPSNSNSGDQNKRLNASIAVFLSTGAAENHEPTVPSEVIQKLFGLTPKEATLALRLAAGESLQEAAEELKISPNTARAHLRSIFAKTGVDRQAKLVRVLLKSVAMLGQ